MSLEDVPLPAYSVDLQMPVIRTERDVAIYKKSRKHPNRNPHANTHHNITSHSLNLIPAIKPSN